MHNISNRSLIAHLSVLAILAPFLGVEHRRHDVAEPGLRGAGVGGQRRLEHRLLRRVGWLALRLLELLERAQQRHLSAFLAGQGGLAVRLQQVDRLARLLGQVRHGAQLLPPRVRDLDRLLLGVRRVRGPPHLVGVAHHLAQVLGIERVQDPEKVVARRPLASYEGVGEVLGEVGVLLVLRPELLHRELVVLRDLDRGDGLLLEQLLLAAEHLLEEVLVDVRGRRKEVLEVLVEVDVEVLLRLELPLHLLGLHVAEATLFALWLRAAVYLVAFHFLKKKILSVKRWLFLKFNLFGGAEGNHVRFRLSCYRAGDQKRKEYFLARREGEMQDFSP